MLRLERKPLFLLLLLSCSVIWMPLPPLFAEATAPPTQVLDIDLAASGLSDLKESRQTVTRQSDQLGDFSLIQRTAVGSGPFYFSGGVRGESFNMNNTPDFRIRQLQDYGLVLSAEYFVGAVKAAYLTIRPGFYFQNHMILNSWDVPIEFATGIPINSALNGVAGVSYGRFYHHPVPIAGLSWTMTPQWRLDALYPDPMLAYTINKDLQAQLAGELLGGGFRSDADPERNTIEYHVYRVGANLAWQLCPEFKLTSGAGIEYERVFDFWRAGESFRATGAPYIRIALEFAR